MNCQICSAKELKYLKKGLDPEYRKAIKKIKWAGESYWVCKDCLKWAEYNKKLGLEPKSRKV